MAQYSESLKSLVRDRIRKTLPEQKRSIEKIQEGRPLDAEENEERKIAFVKQKIGVNDLIANEIANYIPARALHLDRDKTKKGESIQGTTIDYLSTCFLDLGKAASSAVGRIVVASSGSPLGSGFMISDRLLLTNNHVIRNKDIAQKCLIEFFYERDYMDRDLEKVVYRLDPDSFYLFSPEEELDYTLIAIGPIHQGNPEARIGYLPLIAAGDKHVKGMPVNCIEHPNGVYKQLVIRENKLLARTPNTLIYSSDTEEGASGSPIFNDDWEVIALHHYGEPYRAIVDGNIDQIGPLPEQGNEGIRISVIIAQLLNASGLSASEQQLLNAVLNHGFREPSLMRIKNKSEAIVHENNNQKPTNMSNVITNSTLTQNGSPLSGIQSGASQSIVVPIQLNLRINLQVEQGEASEVIPSKTNAIADGKSAAEGFEFEPDTTYSNRRGYSKKFLGVVVPMPELSDDQKELAAINKRAKAGESDIEFKYQHFSVIMNKQRRLAYFTAVNIDGASVVTIKRKTGEVTGGPEAREPWYDDPRIEEDEVCHDSWYRSSGMSIFQRGHLVKRTDPSWGNATKAMKGQADTFHFLNCSPQHFKFNPNKSKWAGIEDWITNTSDDENIRINVFSGPVFEDSDKPMHDIQIPKSFWKVVCWVEDEKLMAVGLLADQSDLIKGMSESIGGESLGEIPEKLLEYHVSIKHISEITGLNFGKLATADIFTGAESIGGQKKLLRSFSELRLRREVVV